MKRRVLVLEIEELLFDTRRVRATSLRVSLAEQGIDIDADAVHAAHAGVPAPLALERLAGSAALDPTGRELVLHRAATLASREFELHQPAFDTSARDHLGALAVEVSLAVVTRATLAQAHRWLASADLEASVATVRSLADLEPDAYATAWREVLQRGFAEQGVAIAATPLLHSAAGAGLRTLRIDDACERGGVGYHPDLTLASLSQLDAAFLAALFPEPHVVHTAP